MNQILKLIILLTVCCVVRGQCDGLTIYDDGIQINTSTVCIRKFKTAECINFYESFNQSQLPEGFPISNTSVESPNTVRVKGIETPLVDNSKDYMYPGLSIQWEPPYTGASRHFCNGYLVIWFTPDANLTMCQLFHVNTMHSEKLLFKYNIKQVRQQSSYTVKVYSMPQPSPQDKENARAFVSTQIQTSVAYLTGNPSEWSPFVAYDIFNNGTVNVSVSLPPADFGITEFIVYLTNSDSNNPVQTVNHSAELRTEQITEFSLLLTALRSDFYQVVVWAQDKFHMQSGLCQCWEWQNSVKTCKNTCGGTSTSLFYVNITNPPNPTTVPETSAATEKITNTDNISPPTTNPNLTPVDRPNDELWPIIVGVVCAFLGLLALAIIGFCLFRNKSKVKYWIQRWCRRSLNPSLVIPPYDSDELPQGAKVSSRLSKKTIYLISADDHEAHVRLVEALVSFLEVHCHCNVILPSRSDHYETGAYAWFLSSVNRSDFIMFVNSKGAEKMIDAYLNKTSYPNRNVGPEGDPFIYSLKHIISSEEVREKSLILVSFHGDHCQKFLLVPQVFKLPKHLRHLLQKIHRLDSSVVGAYNNVLPLNFENIQKLPEGAKMLSASKDVEIYEERNPQWFENNFGDLKKPLCERFLSIDSGYSASDRLDSISQQVSFSDSPTANPEHLPYPTAPVHSYRPAVTSDKDAIMNDFDNMHDMLSCVTIKEVCERMVETKREPDLDEYSFIPPESGSQIICDSYSTAMAAINSNSNNDDRVIEIDDDSFQQTIIPPQNPLDIQLDSFSSAFADINATSEKIFLKGDTKFISLYEDETTGSVSHFDSVSL